VSFKPGDVVKLKSGGPLMTVHKPDRLTVGGKVIGQVEPRKVFCKWYNEKAGKPQTGFFDQEALELYKELKEEQKKDIGFG